MKIISLKSENFKRLKAIEIRPDGRNVIAITGKNGSGKTSVLDSIAAALCGGRALPAKAVRDGEEMAEITVDVGDYKVTRKISATGTSVKVETPDGYSKRSPQSFLDSVVGKISFDPMDFIRLDSKKMKSVLSDLVGLDVEIFDRKLQDLEGRRANLRSRFEAVERDFSPALVNEKPVDAIDVSDLNKQIKAADGINSEYTRAESTVAELRRSVVELQGRARKLQAELESVEIAIKTTTEEGKAKADALKIMKRVDVSEIMARLQIAQEENAKASDRNEKIRRHKIAAEARDAMKTGEADLERARTEQKEAIAKAKFPVPGLSFGTDGVLFNGIPVEQISDAEKIKVGMSVSMALNPTLRVIRLTDGSLLDSDSWKSIEAMAKAKDFQVWIEKVDESGEIGFFIEDGTVKAVK